MPNGYQNRVSNTYWTSPELTYGGGQWTQGSPLVSFDFVPTAAPGGGMDAEEIRWQIQLGGAGHMRIEDLTGPTLLLDLVLPNVANQVIVVRTGAVSASGIRFTPDATVTVVVQQIEVGLSGTY